MKTGARKSAARDPLVVACTASFVVSAVATVAWSTAMTMPMPAGGTMSMASTPLAGHGGLGVHASFVAMGMVMMVAMMLPVLAPMLCRYRDALNGAKAQRVSVPIVIVSGGYFFVWMATGIATASVGFALAELAALAPAVARVVPSFANVVLLGAGLFQFTAWKREQLACWRSAGQGSFATDVGTAWRHGVRLGVQCLRCTYGLMAALLVLGVMDVRAMAFVTAAVALERLARGGWLIARATGAALVVMALVRIGYPSALG